MSRALDDLSSALRPLAFEWIARLSEQGIAVMVIDTLRTPDEHRKNLQNGASSIALSLHLPRRLRYPALPASHPDYDKSDAMDVCPFDQYQLHGPDKLKWDSSDPAWRLIIAACERVGLESGGRWKKPYDPGHGQLPSALRLTSNALLLGVNRS
jgi:hypothetical protein